MHPRIMRYATQFLIDKLIIENGFKVSLQKDQVTHRICRSFSFFLFLLMCLAKATIYYLNIYILHILFVIYSFSFFADKARSLFNCGTRMEKALQRLAEANLTNKSKSPSSTQDSTTQTTEDDIPKINIAIVDTPPNTPSIQTDHLSALFKGIPKALLEKVRIIVWFRTVVDVYCD